MNDKVLQQDKHNDRNIIAKVTKCLSQCPCSGFYINSLTKELVAECFCSCHLTGKGVGVDKDDLQPSQQATQSDQPIPLVVGHND